MDYHYKSNFLVGYGEVDEHNRIKMSALLNFLQDMATMHSKIAGYSSSKCAELKIAWLLLSWHIKLYLLPGADTNIEVKTWSREINGAHAFRAFEVNDENGNLVAQADSMWALINTDTGRPIRPFENMITDYGKIDRKFFEEEKIKIDIPKVYEDSISFKVQRRDIDTNKHCNNTKYIDFALEAISKEVYDNKNISELEIVYKKPVFYGENIEITLSCVRENEYVNLIKKENGDIACLVKTTWK